MRRAVATSLFFFAMFVACAVYGPSLLTPLDAGPDAVLPSDAGDAGPGCNGATWPARPAADDPGTYDGGDIILAVQSIKFDPDAGGGKLVGYDLDRACTCPGKPSCNPSGDAKVVCDDPEGRDNSGGVLLAQFSSFASDLFDSTKLNQKIAAGGYSLLIRIGNYNGSQNDTQVTTAVFISPGMKGIEDGGTPQVPKFDGTDDWTVDPGSLFGGTGPPFIPLPDSVDTMAYVTNGMLVAVLGEVRLVVAGAASGSISLDLSGAVITGHITQMNKKFEIDDAVLAARWPTRRMLTTLQGVKDPLGSGYLCGDSGTYQQIKPLICNARDIATAVQNDNTNAYCDAVSIGLGFVAKPAQIGSVFSKGAAPQPCGAQWDDDCLK